MSASQRLSVVLAVRCMLTGALGGLLVCAARLHPDPRQAQLHRARHDRNARHQPARQPRRCSGGSARATRACRAVFGFWPLQVRGHRADLRTRSARSVCSILLLTMVLMWMRSSRRGLEIRAMMMNPHAAPPWSRIGVQPDRASTCWPMTGGLCRPGRRAPAGADLLRQPVRRRDADDQGARRGPAAAGLGSVQGAVIAAILLGINEALTAVACSAASMC